MVTAPFMIKRVEAMRPGVQTIVDELIDAMPAGPKPVDLVAAHPTMRLATPVEEVPFKHDGSVYGVYELPVTW